MQEYTYAARIIEKLESAPGKWYGAKVGVYRIEGGNEEQVGVYCRNYRSLFRTFFHFRRSEKDYALYSPEYSATRVMELPSCKDIGGEEPDERGFCPVEFYVPCYIEKEWTKGNNVGHKFVVNQPSAEDLIESDFSKPVSPILYYPFGFVAGCVWGDDSSWKIQYLDLTDIEKGVIRRDERFGYIRLPEGIRLEQAIDLDDYNDDPSEEWSYHIIIGIQRKFDLRDGKVVD